MSQSSRTIVVVGGQFGSEAKGHVAAQLVKRGQRLGRRHTLIRVAGPNAGHSVVDEAGRKYALRCIPVGAVLDPDALLVIAAGSEIDLEVLHSEVDLLEADGHEVRKRLFVSDEATILTHAHKTAEAGMHESIGSTGKGIGACRADRIMRRAPIVGSFSNFPYTVVRDRHMRSQYRLPNRDVLIEGTQGYGLGLHAGHYPYCTSSDCRAIDFMAMAGVMPNEGPVEVWIVYRTFPIRVAGNSGKLANETTWEELGQESGGYIQPELTTVTKKVRRVGRWDSSLARESWRANGGFGTQSEAWRTFAALSFVDYLDPEVANGPRLTPKATQAVRDLEASVGFTFHMLTLSDRVGLLDPEADR